MSDYYYPRFPNPEGYLEVQKRDNTARLLTTFKILMAVCVLALVVLVVLFFSAPRAQSEVSRLPAVGDTSSPVIDMDGKVFSYQGQMVLDGKAYNVSLRIEGLTMDDAVKIARMYAGV